ncbi:MAG TPA: hypothetical protein DDW27_01450 [Bacteroidales bacterium]|nr:hypothetical protein [Bacteroidales bacterium]
MSIFNASPSSLYDNAFYIELKHHINTIVFIFGSLRLGQAMLFTFYYFDFYIVSGSNQREGFGIR